MERADNLLVLGGPGAATVKGLIQEGSKRCGDQLLLAAAPCGCRQLGCALQAGGSCLLRRDLGAQRERRWQTLHVQ